MRRMVNADGDIGGASKRILAGFSSRLEAIDAINYDAMVDRSFEHVYGRVIERDIRRPLMWLTASELKNRRHTTSGDLVEMVGVANDCSAPVARGHIKTAEAWGMLSTEKDGVVLYHFLDSSQRAKWNLVLKLNGIARRVVEAQLADPNDLRAGIELFPEDAREDVYYHIIAEIMKKE